MNQIFRIKKYMNNNWLFSHEWIEDMALPDFPEEQMEKVRLPHTNTVLPHNYADETSYQQVMGYRMHFVPEEAWRGKQILLTFEGAAHDAAVFLNGKKAGEHHTGYTAFDVDLTDGILWGKDNVVAVCLDSRETLNTPPFGNVIDYMTYGGIYREVYLTIHEKTWIRDVYAMPIQVKKVNAMLSLDITVENPVPDMEAVLELSEGDGILDQTRIKLNGAKTFTEIHASHFRHWDVEDPYLYELTVTLLCGGVPVDSYKTRIGFRQAEFRANGFWLNGRRLKIRGLDRHQAYAETGYAMPASMQRMDAEILRNELGLNAVRTSHYPQSHHFIDRCDELGLLVFTEMPGWQYIGDEAWKDQAVENVKEMVLQYRNHPSIILWGVRINESQDDDAFYKRTNDVSHSLDPYRQTGGVRYLQKSHFLEDVYTYNDFIHNGTNRGVDKKSKVTPDMSRGYLISEYNGHMFPTKTFDDEPHRRDHALRHARVLSDAMAERDIAGTFGWCMADYHTHQDFGSGDRICYHGVLDLYRNPKMAAAVYSSQESPRVNPVLVISSSMDIGDSPAGFLGPVTAFTNADTLVVYKNGEKIREYTPDHTRYPMLLHPPIEMDDFIGDQLVEKEGFSRAQAEDVKKVLLAAARYGMGNLPPQIKALAAKLMLQYKMTFEDAAALYGKYIGNWGDKMTSYRFDALYEGKIIASVTREPVQSIHLQVIAEEAPLVEGDTYDVRAVRLRMADQNGNVLPYYQEPLSLEVSGAGELTGPSLISLKGGMGGCFIRTIGETGEVTLTISGNGLAPQTMTWNVKRAD